MYLAHCASPLRGSPKVYVSATLIPCPMNEDVAMAAMPPPSEWPVTTRREPDDTSDFIAEETAPEIEANADWNP